ncbi:hypothetical protein ABZP36_017084 [Zizania latifolia]
MSSQNDDVQRSSSLKAQLDLSRPCKMSKLVLFLITIDSIPCFFCISTSVRIASNGGELAMCNFLEMNPYVGKSYQLYSIAKAKYVHSLKPSYYGKAGNNQPDTKLEQNS